MKSEVYKSYTYLEKVKRLFLKDTRLKCDKFMYKEKANGEGNVTTNKESSAKSTRKEQEQQQNSTIIENTIKDRR